MIAHLRRGASMRMACGIGATRRVLRDTMLFATLVAASVGSHAEERKLKIYVVGNGWHAGLWLPASGINALVPSLRMRFPKADTYEIGWGDMGFYQAQEVTAGLAMQALFASKGSLLHVVGLSIPASGTLKGVDFAEICVSADEYQHMAQLVAQAFALGTDGKPVAFGRGLYGDSQFYMANGDYSLFHTCNRWSAEVLQAGGVPITPRFSLTAGGVLSAVRKQAKSCAADHAQANRGMAF
jgi:uncharacterized protein (TIGR02117 family)